ncbi:AAT-domain-containing protein [Tothia fuscella]|uniref:AAT-domain-containing protein n=1 Tax=Tothia fuscella TaxID=1048955 RepID=A0A9P4U1M0_9PEZI|nr:AAT-domain-containing protein [Tothia fuscella]
MLEVTCTGTPFEMGRIHGQFASLQISRTLKFYEQKFKDNSNLTWPEVEETALKFTPFLNSKFPDCLSEMEGIAAGSSQNLASILALNVRTEITYGLMKDDGCTTFACKIPNESFLAQNWDWQVEQKENLIVLTIARFDKPSVKMITEAGIIGKIGLNDAGVGVCLNAITARGLDVNRLPVHLGLRLCLDSKSKDEAVAAIERVGIAAACTICVADISGAVALECSSKGIQKLDMDEKGRLYHSNHFLKEQQDVVDKVLPHDTLERIKRIEVLADGMSAEDVNIERIAELLKDGENVPTAICRAKGGKSNSATIFSIVSDLTKRRAQVILGRPTEPEKKFWLEFTPN